jgi:hypothetical protein
MSIIVSRTAIGRNLINQARAARKISLTRVDVGKVLQSQRVNLVIKKKDLAFRLSFLRLMGKTTPRFTPVFSNQKSFFSVLRTFYMYFNIKISSKNSFQWLLTYTPLPLIRLYYGIYRALSLV